jgi:fibronectin type 3 domain-containing protein
MPRRSATRRSQRLSPSSADRQRFGFEPLESRKLLSFDGTNAASYRYDIADGGADTGVDTSETVLNAANVNTSTFSKQFSVSVDGQVLAQPIYLGNVNITTGANQGLHDVTFVATEHDSVYAIDADSGVVLWKDSLLNSFTDPATGGTVTVTTVPAGDVSSGDISPEIGITDTPAIDTSTGFLYVVAKTKDVFPMSNGSGGLTPDTADPHYLNTLYKIDITNGSETSAVIADTTYTAGGSFIYNSGPYVLGTGSGAITVNNQSEVYFNSLREFFRPAVLLDAGQVILASGSHGDNGPYHGWMLSYSESTLGLTGVLNLTPNGDEAGIWQGAAPIAVDPQGYFYLETGNGSFNQNASNFPNGDTSQLPIDGDYGDSFVKIAFDPTTTQSQQNINGWGLKVVDYFTPQDQNALSSADQDLGSGGPIVLPDSVGSAAHPHLLVGGGKEGKIYLLDRDDMGGFSTTDARAVQTQGSAVGGILSAPAYFNGEIYFTGGYSGGISAFSIVNGAFSTSPTSSTPDSFGNLDGGPVISADGSVNGIVWGLDRGTGQLRAYSAANLQTELYTSAQASNNRDAVGAVMKFTSPLVANGRVYLGTSNALVVYGVPSRPTSPPAAPTGLTATAPLGSEVQLSWTDNSDDESEFDIERSLDGNTWTQIGTVGVNVSSFNDTTAQALTTYDYRVKASNSVGSSAYTYANDITTPGVSTLGTGDGLLGQYYTGTSFNFSGRTPVLSRVDPTINFNWNNVSPDPSVPQTNYSVRWTGEIQAQYSEPYKFSTVSDDGVEVIVNGQVVINDNSPHSPTVDTSAPIQLVAGQSYAIEVDYFQAGGGAEAILDWSSPSTPQNVVPQSQLFSGSAPPAPVLLAPVAASGTQINLAWTENSQIETGFEVQREAGTGGTFSTVAVVPPNVTTWMDTGLSPSTNYTYQVRALNFAADSAFSNPVSLTTPVPPATPSGAHPTRITTNEIDFAWVNNASDGTATRILRSPDTSGNFILVGVVPPTTETFDDLGSGGAGLTPGNQYDYHIQVGNVAGYSDFTGFTVQTLTNPPATPIAVGASGQVTLTWTAPAGAATFNVYRSTTSGGEGTVPIATGISGNVFIDTGLTNGQTYEYLVTAVDSGGESAPSAETSATPLPSTAVAPPPGKVSVTAGDTGATLNWIAAAGATSYNVYRGTASGGEVLIKAGLTSPTFVDTGLTNGTPYFYEVSSVNSLGEGSLSAEASVTPHTLPPPTPINVVATPGDGTVSLTWSAASDAQSYDIYRSTDEGDESLYAQGVVGTSFVDDKVSDGTTYFYEVSAANGVGQSNLSIEVSATPLPPLPTAPSSLVAVGINDAQIQLQWQESSTTVTSLEVDRSTDGVNFTPLTTLDPGVTSYLDSSSLAPGVTYSYQLVAANLAGSSGPSNTAHAAVLAKLVAPWADGDIGSPALAGAAFFYRNALTVSGAGSNIAGASDQFHFVYQSLTGNGSMIARVATQSSGEAGVMIRNTLSANSAFADMVLTPAGGALFGSRTTAGGTASSTTAAGYAAPDWVELTRNGSTITAAVSTNGIDWTTVGSATISMNSQVFIGLAVTSQSVNALGTAVFDSVAVNSSTARLPLAPTNLSALVRTGTSAGLVWAEADTSQFGYQVYRQDSANGPFVLIATLPSSASSFVDTGLVPGATYSYQVAASNTVGDSARSNTGQVTLPVVPIAPSLLQPNQVATTSAGLSWQLNSSNDTGVNVYRSDGNSNNFVLQTTLPAGSTAYVDNSLQAGTAYEYRVTAINAAGESPFSDSGLTTLPNAPAAVNAAPEIGQIMLTWTAPAGALAYNVYRGLSPGAEGATPYASGINNNSFSDAGVNDGTTYYYRVTAVNFSGESAVSQETSATFYSSAPTNTSALVNGGAAQRSMVTSLTLAFSQPVTIDPAGVSLVVPDGQPGTVPTLGLQTTDGGLTYTVTFSGNGVIGGSIADGVYQLNVAPGAITNPIGLSPATGISLGFVRLFGDISGNGIVNNADLFQLRSAYATSAGDAAYLPGFDYNSNGIINNADLFQIRSRYGETLPLIPSNNQAAAPAAFPALQNLVDPADVDANGQVTPLDALAVLNVLQVNSGPFTVPADVVFTPTSDYYDVNGDGSVSPLDALLVVNELNATTRAAAAPAAVLASTAPSANTPSVIISSATPPPAATASLLATAGAAAIRTGDSVSAVAETLAGHAARPAAIHAASGLSSIRVLSAPPAVSSAPAASSVRTVSATPVEIRSALEAVPDLHAVANPSDEDLDSLIGLLAADQLGG